VRGAGYVSGEVCGKRAVQFRRRRCDLMQLTDLYPQCHRRYSYCHPENKVSLGLVEGANNKIRVLQRRAYGYRDEDYLKLKIVACVDLNNDLHE
jgi:hypothetical protein